MCVAGTARASKQGKSGGEAAVKLNGIRSTEGDMRKSCHLERGLDVCVCRYWPFGMRHAAELCFQSRFGR
jgi:hypothetical protein